MRRAHHRATKQPFVAVMAPRKTSLLGPPPAQRRQHSAALVAARQAAAACCCKRIIRIQYLSFCSKLVAQGGYKRRPLSELLTLPKFLNRFLKLLLTLMNNTNPRKINFITMLVFVKSNIAKKHLRFEAY